MNYGTQPRMLLWYLERGPADMGIVLKAMIEALDGIRLALIRTHESNPARPSSRWIGSRRGSSRGSDWATSSPSETPPYSPGLRGDRQQPCPLVQLKPAPCGEL